MMLIRALNDEHDLVKTGEIFEEKCKKIEQETVYFFCYRARR